VLIAIDDQQACIEQYVIAGAFSDLKLFHD
jgi:hypothetical protein